VRSQLPECRGGAIRSYEGGETPPESIRSGNPFRCIENPLSYEGAKNRLPLQSLEGLFENPNPI